MNKWIFILISLFLVQTASYSQVAKPRKTKKKSFYKNKRLDQPLFRWVTGDYIRHGIQFSVGPTYSFTKLKGTTRIFDDVDGPNDQIEVVREARGRLGAFAEVGMVHITKRPRKFIHYLDWGVGFKLYGGTETTEAHSFLNDALTGTRQGDSKFYNGHLYGRFDIHSVYQMTPNLFLDNSLGINVDYMIMPGNKDYQGAVIPYDQKFQGPLNAQLHYSFGLGIKSWPDKGFFVIPSVELPILGMYEWNKGTPQFHWFSSKYYPVHVRVKFVWLFKKPKGWCPPVETNERDKEYNNQFMNK